MHAVILRLRPEALAVFRIESPELLLDGFVVENAKDGFGGPLVLQNYCASKQGVVLKVQEDAEIMQVAAQVQRLGFVKLDVLAIDLEILLHGNVWLFRSKLFDFLTHLDPPRRNFFADVTKLAGKQLYGVANL